MRGLLHFLGGSPIPGIIAVLLAAVLLIGSELRAQRYSNREVVLDKVLFRTAVAIGVLAALAIALRFAAVA